jgi:hypothetical protein
MGNLDTINELRREAKELHIPRYNTMKTEALREAVTAAKRTDVEVGLANETEIEALRAEFPGATEDRQESIRVRLAQLGAVVYPPGTPEHEQYTKDLRAALAQWADAEAFGGEALPEPGEAEHPDGPGFVRIAFERIGRARGQFAVTVKADLDPDDMAHEVYRLASRHLTSSSFSVTVDVLAGKAWIEGGRFGIGTVCAANAEGEPVLSTIVPSIVDRHETVDFMGERPFRHLGNFATLATLCDLAAEDGKWGWSTDLTPVDCLGCLDAYTKR